MKPNLAVPRGSCRARMLSVLVAALTLTFVPMEVRAGGVVTNATEAALRAALAGGGTVTVACDGTITLAKTLVIATNTVLDATGHAVTLSGGGVRRVLEVASGVQFWLNNVTVARGGGTNLGAGLFNGGELWLNNCTFISNKVVTGPCYGGAIYHRSGQLNITGCSFIKNVAAGGTSTGLGGAIGATYSSQAGAMNITNSTFTQNGATTGGGAIGTAAAVAPKTNGPIVLVNCTFAGNTNGAVRAGGGEVFLKNTLARSTTGGNFTGTFQDLGHNISADASKALNSGTSRTNTDPQFGVLGHYGGPTPTVPLATNSPAINAGDCAGSPPFDQRGYPRPYAGGCDAGAFEATVIGPNAGQFAFTNDASMRVVPGLTNVLFTVFRSGGAAQTSTVVFATGGTAIPGVDYTPTNGTLVFPEGEIVRTFSVDLKPGASVPRVLFVSLSNPTAGATLGVPSTVTFDFNRQTLAECSEAALRDALIGGGTVTFACDGTIPLTSTVVISNDTTLDARGHDMTLSGGNAVRLFRVESNAKLTLLDLKLADGYAVGDAGTEAHPDGWPGVGGAIYNNGGGVVAEDCWFLRNGAVGGAGLNQGVGARGNGGAGLGGAIYSVSGSVSLANSAFHGNSASGGRGWYITASTHGLNGSALGGAIHVASGTLIQVNSRFVTNTATGAGAFGGAMFVTNATSRTENSVFTSNAAQGHQATLAAGGAAYQTGGDTAWTGSLFTSNSATGGRAAGFDNVPGTAGSGAGGGLALYGTAALTNCSVLDNRAESGGGTWNATSVSTLPAGFGGGIYSEAGLAMQNCTVAGNRALGGSDLQGGNAFGGGLAGGYAVLNSVTIANNLARGVGGVLEPGGPPITPALSRGGGFWGSAILRNTLLALNVEGGNFYGTVTDEGNNLSSDASIAFTAPGSLTNTDPMLGSLGDYGGLTPTIPLLAGSPAIDAGNPAWCPSTDQRGISRPIGAACDIGAFEGTWLPIFDEDYLRAELARGGVVRFTADGTVTLSASLDLTTNVVIDATGYRVTLNGNDSVRVLTVPAGVSATLSNLTITGGRSTNGGGICNEGNLSLVNCLIVSNSAVGAAGLAGTNGLPGLGVPQTSKNASAGTPGQDGLGGGVFNLGTLTATNTIFARNWTQGGTGGKGGDGGYGGTRLVRPGVYADYEPGGDAGDGGAGGQARGGGLYNAGRADLKEVAFPENNAVGGTGGAGGLAGEGGLTGFIVNDMMPPGAVSHAGSGGLAAGGALWNSGTLSVAQSAVFSNDVVGGSGGRGANGVPRSLFDTDGVLGIAGDAGNGIGAAVANAGVLQVINTTVGGNRASGGFGGSGGRWFATGSWSAASGRGGNATGGAIDNSGGLTADFCTIWDNDAAGGGQFYEGITPVGSTNLGTVFGTTLRSATNAILTALTNSILGSAASTSNCWGTVTDGGHNLCSDASAAFTAPGSMNNTDPLLGELADNGGPTLTMALLPGSPAIDAADSASCPPTDQRGVSRPVGGACDIGAFEFVLSKTITTCSEAALRDALIGGGTVAFACDGVIALTSTLVISNDTTLDARGHDVTISGSNAVRLFWVNSNVNLTLVNLKLADGYAIGSVGEIAAAIGGADGGGAVLNQGNLAALNCVFAGNVGVGGSGWSPPWSFPSPQPGAGGAGEGGAVRNLGGVLQLTNCLFAGNICRGGLGGSSTGPYLVNGATGGTASGGALFSTSGQVMMANCQFLTNQVAPGAGGSGAKPGLNNSTFGGAVGLSGGDCDIARNEFIGNLAGFGGRGGAASGGAIALNGGNLTVTDSLFATNHLRGGSAYQDEIILGAGPAAGGALYLPAGSTFVTNCSFIANQAEGGTLPSSGGTSRSGTARGGAVFNGGIFTMINSTIAENQALAGSCEPKWYGDFAGDAFGGAIFNDTNSAVTELTHVTMTGNGAVRAFAPGISDLGLALGGAVWNTNGTVRLRNSILELNKVSVHPGVLSSNWWGAVTDDGNNLSSDASVALNAAGSRTNTYSNLGGLGSFGGPTPTIMLRANSPAIDAGNPAWCPPTDQRGVARPFGAACDIGAFEGSFPNLPQLTMIFTPALAATGSVVVLTYTLSNPNTNALSNVSFANTLPSELRVASVPGLVNSCGSGAISAVAGGGLVTVTNAALAANQTCSFAVNVTGLTAGLVTNTAGPVSSTESGIGAVMASAVLSLASSINGPSVVTGPASNVQEHSATLAGSVNPNGAATAAWFEYGATASYGSMSSIINLPLGYTAANVTADLANLPTKASLHYRLVAQNIAGTTYGADQVFSALTYGVTNFALQFDYDLVQIGRGGGMDGLTQGTIEMWVRWSGVQPTESTYGLHGAIFSRNGSYGRQTILALDNANPALAHVTWSPFSTARALTGQRLVGDGVWHHVAVTFAPGAHRLYLDGVLEASGTQNGVLGTDPAGYVTLASLANNATFARCTLDEVRVWSMPRTDIAFNMRRPLDSATPGLIGYWRLDEGSGNVAHDATGHGYDGTLSLYDGPLWVQPTNTVAYGLYVSSIKLGNQLRVTLTGQPNQSFVLQRTTDLINWSGVVTNVLGASGQYLYTEPSINIAPQRLYRVRTP